MTRTPKDASAARTGPSTTDSDTAARAPAAAAAEAAPLAGGGDVEETASAVDATLVAEPRAEDDSDCSSSDGEIPLCDAPVVKKRKVEARTSQVVMTDSERYKREDAGCAERLKKQEPELLPCRDPDEGEDDQGVGARFQGYDGFTIGGPPVFR
jgi:hypothetical protein